MTMEGQPWFLDRRLRHGVRERPFFSLQRQLQSGWAWPAFFVWAFGRRGRVGGSRTFLLGFLLAIVLQFGKASPGSRAT